MKAITSERVPATWPHVAGSLLEEFNGVRGARQTVGSLFQVFQNVNESGDAGPRCRGVASEIC